MQTGVAKDDDDQAKWHQVRDGDVAIREKMVEKHLALARTIAAKLYAKRYHDEIEFDDYLQYGMVGLMEAVDRYDPARGASFPTYASYRIEGAILNGIERLTEKQQQISLRKRVRQKRIESINAGAEADSTDTFQQLASIAVGLALGFLLEESGLYRGSSEPTTEDVYQSKELEELKEQVVRSVKALPAKEQRVIRYHYLFAFSFEQIAEDMQLTKGRVSQLHHQGLRRLRAILRASNQIDARF